MPASKKIKGVGDPSDGQMVSRTVSEYTSGRDTHNTVIHSQNIARLNKVFPVGHAVAILGLWFRHTKENDQLDNTS